MPSLFVGSMRFCKIAVCVDHAWNRFRVMQRLILWYDIFDFIMVTPRIRNLEQA